MHPSIPFALSPAWLYNRIMDSPMRITDIVWKESVVEKLIGKHGVLTSEAEGVLLSRPVIRRVAKGRVRGEDV